MEEHITIKKITEEQDLYAQLQEKSLKEVQRLSGEVWTDYNVHDPGVTLLDALNFVLLETDYRLHFELQDYLSSQTDGFQPEKYSLLVPTKVFPVNPVTEMDYRKLFISNIRELCDVRIKTDPATGIYDFIFDIWPDVMKANAEKDEEGRLFVDKKFVASIISRIYSLYHSHRNLCENVRKISLLEYDYLYLDIGIEINETVDQNQLLALIYNETQTFLRGGTRFSRIDDLLDKGKTPDEILDGPQQEDMIVDETSLRTNWQKYDSLQLYRNIKKLLGIVHISVLQLSDGNKHMWPMEKKDNDRGYTLYAFGTSGHKIKVTCGGKPVVIDYAMVERNLSAYRTDNCGDKNRTINKNKLDTVPFGNYRNIFTHYPVSNDLPELYHKNMDKHFSDYLESFDGIIRNGLEELKWFPEWMAFHSSPIGEKEEKWMDILDSLYGENSNPTFLRNYENTEERRKRRIAFLQGISLWGLNRGKAMNICKASLWKNIERDKESGVESYMKKLLNLEKYNPKMFLIEQNLLNYKNGFFHYTPEVSFHVSFFFVFGGGLMEIKAFRNDCERLLRERIPAHIELTVFWFNPINKDFIEQFENTYLMWKHALFLRNKKMLEITSYELKKMMADDYNWYSKV